MDSVRTYRGEQRAKLDREHSVRTWILSARRIERSFELDTHATMCVLGHTFSSQPNISGGTPSTIYSHALLNIPLPKMYGISECARGLYPPNIGKS